MKRNHKSTRRIFVRQTVLIAVSMSLPSLSSCNEPETGSNESGCLTTADILGPFYKAGAPIRENLIPVDSTGVPLLIRGNVYSECNRLLTNAVVEIWNADENGDYDLSELYKFRGRHETDARGEYIFRSIVPGRYLNGGTYRPSHIHFRVTANGHRELISQIYFKDDPFVNDDPWAGNASASARILEIEKNENGIDTVTFDIHLRPS